jgi:hypothetical protein
MSQLSGVMDSPERVLSLSAPRAQPWREQINRGFHRLGFRLNSHHVWMLFVDLFGLVWIWIFWGVWVTGLEQASFIQQAASYVFEFDVLFVFMILFRALFMAAMFLAHLASSMLALFVINLVWFTYTYVITFFYLPTENSKFPSILIFWFVIRFFSSLIAAHKCFTNHQKVGFTFPKFHRHWISVIATNKFIRIVPFMFEIQALMLWLSRKTLVPLVDFFIVRDIALQVEVLMARQTNKSYQGPPRVARTYIIGGVFLFGLAVLLFAPLFYVVDSGQCYIQPASDGRT